MNAILNRGIFLLICTLSVAIWLVVSMFTDGAIFQLVKSDYRFADNYESIALKWPMLAIIWSAIVVGWTRMVVSVALRNIAFGMSVVFVWTAIMTALTAARIDLLWEQNWTVSLALQISFWALEIVVAVKLVQWTAKPFSFVAKRRGMVIGIAIALAWLAAGKALLLFCSPGVVLRM